jgi:glycosyltransferase involved in cell wall biosynthesis
VTPPPAPSDPLPKIGDLTAEAGIRRIHVFAWRDLDDVEAGGSEVHIAHVAKLWAAAGLEVMLRTSWAQGHPPMVRRDGYEVVRRAGRYLVFPRAVGSELVGRMGKRDALVEIWNGMPFFSPVWARGPRVVFLHHVHAEMWRMVLPENLAKAGDFIERRLAPPLYRSSRVVTLSESSRRELIDLGYKPDRVSAVPPGIDARFRPGGRRAVEPLVVAVGRLVPVKRYERLIRAAHEARRSVPDLQLVIVGEGPEREGLLQLIDELDASSWISIRGSVSDEQLVRLYRRAWVVASASAREGWGMTLTEAAACGTPAVATRIAGHEDAVTDGVTGLLAPIDALGAAMARVVTDHELRRSLGEAALVRAAKLSWPATATELMRILAGEALRRRAANLTR